MSYDKVKALLAKGISRPTLFQVMIPNITREANDQLEFLCKETRVPEVTADSIAVSGHEAMGVVREQPTRITYSSPFSITVISDRDYTVYKALREWFDSLAVNANPFALQLPEDIARITPFVSGNNQRINYYNSIVRNITLKKLEQNGLTRPEDARDTPANAMFKPFEVIFNNAYPIRIGDITLSSEQYDSRVEFKVDFAYETYTLDTRTEIVRPN